MNNGVHTRSHSSLFQFEGELRTDHVEGLRAMVGTGPTAGCVLVDCRRVATFAEGALEALVAFERDIMSRGGKVMLVGVHHPALRHGLLLDWVAPPERTA
jgi:hypothetical protein